MTLLLLAGNELAVAGRSTQLLLGDIEDAFWGFSFLKDRFALRNNFTSLILIDDRSALRSSPWSFQASSSHRIASSSVTFLTNCGAVDSESSSICSMMKSRSLFLKPRLVNSIIPCSHSCNTLVVLGGRNSNLIWDKFGRHFRLSIYPICDTVSTQYKVCSYYINA